MAGITLQQRRLRLAQQLAASVPVAGKKSRADRINVQVRPQHVFMLGRMVDMLQGLALPGAVVTRSHVTRYAIEVLYRDMVADLPQGEHTLDQDGLARAQKLIDAVVGTGDQADSVPA
jgi:hypothetical protein